MSTYHWILKILKIRASRPCSSSFFALFFFSSLSPASRSSCSSCNLLMSHLLWAKLAFQYLLEYLTLQYVHLSHDRMTCWPTKGHWIFQIFHHLWEDDAVYNLNLTADYLFNHMLIEIKKLSIHHESLIHCSYHR